MKRTPHQLNRRSFLAGSLGLTLLRRQDARAQADDPVLQMLCWAGYDDPAATTGFRVQSQRIGANDEIFTFLRSGGPGRFDLVTPSDGVVQGLARVGLIQPLDLSRLSNIGNLLPRFQSPEWSMLDGLVYALPISWRTSPMIYNPTVIASPPSNWTDLSDPSFTGHIVMTDDVLSHFIVWNRALGATDPTRVTKSELEQTVQELQAVKRDRVALFVNNMTDLANELASGRSWVSTAGQENVLSFDVSRDANLQLARPAPGDFSVCDSLCIAAGAPNLDAAYAFLDHLISDEAQMALAERLYRGTVSSTAIAVLEPAVQSLYSYDNLDAVFAFSPLVGFPPLEADAGEIAAYVDWVVAWDRVRFTSMKALLTPTPKPTSSPTASAS